VIECHCAGIAVLRSTTTAEVVELGRKGDRSVAEVARDLDLTETAVRRWVNQAEIVSGHQRRPPGSPTFAGDRLDCFQLFLPTLETRACPGGPPPSDPSGDVRQRSRERRS